MNPDCKHTRTTIRHWAGCPEYGVEPGSVIWCLDCGTDNVTDPAITYPGATS